MKKIKVIVSILILLNFSNNVWGNTSPDISISAHGQSPHDNLQQVYQSNNYAIDQLEKIVRFEKKRPYRIGAQLKSVDIPMLVFKLNSLNYLIRRYTEPDISVLYHPLKENLILNSQGLLLQSQNLLLNLDNLYKNYPSLTQDKKNLASVASWYDKSATPLLIYKQLLRIEQFLYGLKSVINPKSVYAIILEARAIIFDYCPNNKIKQTPLIMGKRPKDVYSQLFSYLKLLSMHTQSSMPGKGPVHILPEDVFDLALIAMVYSRDINKSYSLKKTNITTKNHSVEFDFITPSHVYQAVTKNIEILECAINAS